MPDSGKLGDRFWRLRHLYKIRTKERKVVQFHPNGIQQRLLTSIAGCMDARGKIIKPIRNFTLKFRQGGISTLFLLFYLDDTLWHGNTQTGILSHKRESLSYLWDIVRFAYDSLPPDIKPALGEDSKTSISFHDRNSKMFISLSIRSTGIHNLHISEFAFCHDDEIRASLGACAPTANITAETTGNGVGNEAYELYSEAKQGLSPFTATFFPWFLQTEYRQPLNGIDPTQVMGHLSPAERKFMERASADFGVTIDAEQMLYRRYLEKQFRGLRPQEYPETDDEAFLTTGHKFFNPRKLHRLLLEAKDHARANPPEMDDQDDAVIWERPQKGHIYVAGADTSEGGGDYSYLKIVCVTCRREAMRYRALCGVDHFYRVCDKWGRAYWDCLLAVERNNHGHAVILGLDEICRYPNLYKEESVRHLVDVSRAGKGIDVAQNRPRIGWQTDRVTKPMVLDELKFAIEGDSAEDEDHFMPEFTVLDDVLLAECLTFEQVDGKLEAIEGKHDDGVMATAIAFQMYKKQKRLVRHFGQEKSSGIYIGQTRESI